MRRKPNYESFPLTSWIKFVLPGPAAPIFRHIGSCICVPGRIAALSGSSSGLQLVQPTIDVTSKIATDSG